ncbi:MAG TPA: PqiC family protein [Nitrospiria bacterium]|nr:PqiC family protein [Nitrospiria bacterium]
MTTLRNARLVLIALVSIALAACGASAPSHFYTLDSTATPEGAPSAAYSVSVGPVSIPAAVDRPQFVVQDGPNRVSVEEFNRWVAPLENSIARVVAGDLSALLGTPRVAVEPLAHFDPDYRVTLDIQQFESAPGRSALIDAVWTVRPAAGGPARSGRTVAQEPAQGAGFEALAAAHSRALAQVSRDIAAAIRAEAEQAK